MTDFHISPLTQEDLDQPRPRNRAKDYSWGVDYGVGSSHAFAIASRLSDGRLKVESFHDDDLMYGGLYKQEYKRIMSSFRIPPELLRNPDILSRDEMGLPERKAQARKFIELFPTTYQAQVDLKMGTILKAGGACVINKAPQAAISKTGQVSIQGKASRESKQQAIDNALLLRNRLIRDLDNAIERGTLHD